MADADKALGTRAANVNDDLRVAPLCIHQQILNSLRVETRALLLCDRIPRTDCFEQRDY